MTTAMINPPPAQSPASVAGSTPQAASNTGWTPHRWTLESYRKLGGMDEFRDLKTMLIHGEIYVMVVPNPPHNLSLGLTEDWLKSVFAVGHHVRNQMALDVGTDNDPSPDLAIVVGTRRDYATRQATTAVLVVEISDITLFTDMTTKAELYATAGVPEYWVIDIQHRQLHVLRDPVALPTGLGATAYRTHLTLSETDTASALAATATSILVSELLP